MEFSKAERNVGIQNLKAFMYINNNQLESINSFSSKNRGGECPEITRNVQILCEKNFNTFLKKTKVILNKCNDILFSLTERFNILKTPICPNLIYKYDISIKIIAHPSLYWI